MTEFSCICKKSERLELRPLRMEDYKCWIDGFAGQLPQQTRFDEGPFDWSDLTEEWLRNRLKQRAELAEKDKEYLFACFRISDGEHIGFLDIVTQLREDFQCAHGGYAILNQYWGQGYATEALRLLIRIAFEDLDFHRLELHINTDNPASCHVAEKAGMTYECIRKAFILEDGIWTDNKIYYINNEKMQ